LEDDSSELETLVFKLRVQEIQHFVCLVLTLDLIYLEVGLSTSENADSLGDGSLDLLVQLVNTDVINEGLNRFVVFLAFENRTDLDFDENVVIGGAGLHIHLEDYVLLGDKVLDLGLQKD
jgi:hypothetical protein